MMPDTTTTGFDRPKTESLNDTVKFYERHLLICTGTMEWSAHIDQDGGFGQALDGAVKARAAEIPHVVKINACDEPSRIFPAPEPGEAAEPHEAVPPLAPRGYDVLVFPDAVRYLGIREADLPVLVEDQLVRGRISERLPHEPVTGRHIFVCVHGARDPRCGACGPAVAEALAAEVVRRGLSERAHVHRTSHVGGHQYAANVLIYPEGDWYGYVSPADVPRIVEQHILRGAIVPELWRGRMGRP
jgi:(2Fe-2S) ferredoxin